MVSVSLPNLPKGKEFEEYISAFFQSGGNYIERNIIEREVEEVLELDIITTDYCLSPPEIKLLEVKSGDWGFPDLFKVRGWMDYLNIDKGIIIASKEKANVDFFKKKAKGLNIDLVVIPNLSESKKALSELINNTTIENVDISTWRFSYWVERNLLKRLNHKKKSHPDKKCFKALTDYYFEVNSGIFFTENIVQKVDRLYSTFRKFPRISATCGNELIGNTFDDEWLDTETLPPQIYEDTYYKCNYNDIQISTFIEHRARLAILKNVVDYKLYKEAGFKNKSNDILKISGLDFEISLLDLLPPSFKEGLDTISKHRYFHKYPVFWQWFMWIFGGFILKDYEEKEYEILSQKTGIPRDEIPTALESYQILFPRDDGWFMDLPTSNMKLMKMFPVPFMGVGTNYRRLIYTESGKLEDLKLTGMHTLNGLIKWNNLTVKVLQDDK